MVPVLVLGWLVGSCELNPPCGRHETYNLEDGAMHIVLKPRVIAAAIVYIRDTGVSAGHLPRKS
jgi:hypothetical protein